MLTKSMIDAKFNFVKMPIKAQQKQVGTYAMARMMKNRNVTLEQALKMLAYK